MERENLHKAPSKRLFRNRIHSLLRRADARGSADIIYSSRVRHSYWDQKV